MGTNDLLATAPPRRRPVPSANSWSHPEREDITIYGILSALSDPTRLEIVRNLSAASPERCPCRVHRHSGSANRTSRTTSKCYANPV